MTPEQKAEVLNALRHGHTDDPELDQILEMDVAALEPLIDNWIVNARDWYFSWTIHKPICPAKVNHFEPCTCGLLTAIGKRRQV